MRRETGQILIPTHARIDVAALARACAPPWHSWAGHALARAERTADGRVHLVTVRTGRGGVILRATGAGAAQAEALAPLTARVRRALPLERDRVALRGTSAFEDAALALVDADERARRALVRAGRPCPAARALRTFPDPEDVLARSVAAWTRAIGRAAPARRLHALARAFVAVRPPDPSAT